MAIHSLTANSPEKPNLENLKKRAKSLHKAVRAGDESALSRIGPYFGDPSAIGLQAVQLVLAREFGFSSWRMLKEYLERDSASLELTGDQLANQFLDLVIVQYNSVTDQGPKRFEQAKTLLENHPEIRTENIYTAAAIGDSEQIDRWLNISRDLINQRGGYHHWAPLMYAAYARLPGSSSLSAALRLLDRGADPNAYYMWNGQYKFTALTGAFGQGEAGPVKQPEHPDYLVLARALLERGANPNDSQAAYNRCFEPDNSCFELLLEFGLSSEDKNNWLLDEGDRLVPHPSDTMHFHLIQAIRRGNKERANLLIDHGVDLDKPDDSYESRTKGKSPYEAAMLMGEREIADYLLLKGAKKVDIPVLSQFQSACSAGDVAVAKGVLKLHPSVAQQIKPFERELLCDAVNRKNKNALHLMIELGFDVNDNGGRPPLHEAALNGDLAIVKYLIECGADPTLRDPGYMTPAIVFAQHGEADDVVAYLDTVDMDIFTAAARGALDQLKSQLSKDPAILEMRFKQIRPTNDSTHVNDWMTPLVYAVLNNQIDTVRYMLTQGADSAVCDENDKFLIDIARNSDCDDEIISMLQDANDGL